MPWGNANSSASGVAMPGTPPIMEPLALSDVAPDTQRDEQLAVRAERRRLGTVAAICAVIGVVAVAGYFAGRRTNEQNPTTATPSAPVSVMATPPSATVTPPASAAPLPTPPATTPSGAGLSPNAVPVGSATPSASASASTPGLRPQFRRPRTRPATTAPEGEPKPDDSKSTVAVPDNPFEPAPAPAPVAPAPPEL